MVGGLGVLVVLVLVVVVTRPLQRDEGGRPGMLAAAFDKAGLVPLNGTMLGSWVQPGAGNEPRGQREAVIDREQLLGRPFDIVHDFHAFAEPFPTPFDRWAATERTLLLSWNGTSAASIVAGAHDDLIRTRARALRDLGTPLFLRFWWEMNTEDKATWADPGEFVAAWRHVRTLFREAGADRVAWVWCPTAEAFAAAAAKAPATGGGGTEAARWWPGDDWVDWVCADGYNFAPVVAGADYRSFSEIFAPFRRWARRTAKPTIIGEFGVLERAAGEKAAWVADTAASISEADGDFGAVVYFDSRRIIDGRARDWRPDTSAASIEAFQMLGRTLATNLRRAR